MNPHPLATFLSYSHANQKLRTKLRKHFVQLERDGLVRLWDDRELQIGQEFNVAIGEELERTEVFLLLVSAEFIASSYCSGIEMKRALERHGEGAALVLPIIVAPCDWQYSPIAKLVVAPTDGKPISTWRPTDAGWADATAQGWQVHSPGNQRVLQLGRGRSGPSPHQLRHLGAGGPVLPNRGQEAADRGGVGVCSAWKRKAEIPMGLGGRASQSTLLGRRGE